MLRLFSLLLIAAAALCSSARVSWNTVTNDFGAFKEDDGKVQCTFRFVNDGTANVSVRAARSSCGCTVPNYTKSAIAPGDTGVVNVTFNPSGRPGRFKKTVSVSIDGDDGSSQKQVLTITGVVIGSSNTLKSRFPVESGALKLRSTMLPFGTVLKGSSKSAFLEVYNSSTEPLVPRWDHKPECVRISASSDTIPPGEQVVFVFNLTPDNTALYGILTDSVTISANGVPPLKLDLTAILEEDFSKWTPGQLAKAPVIAIESDRIDFGEFPRSGGPVSREFTIANNGKGDLLLRRVYTTDPGITVTPSADKIKKGKQATVTVTVDPTLLPGDLLNARIQVIANDPENPITIVRAVGLPQE